MSSSKFSVNTLWFDLFVMAHWVLLMDYACLQDKEKWWTQ